MTVRTNETGEEEDCLKHVKARHWVGATGVGKIEALRDTIFRCYDGFWEHHKELTARVVSLELERRDRACRDMLTARPAMERNPYEATVLLLEKRVSELEQRAPIPGKWNRVAEDRPLSMTLVVDDKPFTADDVRRWRRMEGPAAYLANASWNDHWCWPSADVRVGEPLGQVKRKMRELAEAMKP